MTSISNENFVIVSYKTFYTGRKDDDDESLKNSETLIFPKLKSWKFEEFTNKGFKIRLEF